MTKQLLPLNRSILTDSVEAAYIHSYNKYITIYLLQWCWNVAKCVYIQYIHKYVIANAYIHTYIHGVSAAAAFKSVSPDRSETIELSLPLPSPTSSAPAPAPASASTTTWGVRSNAAKLGREKCTVSSCEGNKYRRKKSVSVPHTVHGRVIYYNMDISR